MDFAFDGQNCSSNLPRMLGITEWFNRSDHHPSEGYIGSARGVQTSGRPFNVDLFIYKQESSSQIEIFAGNMNSTIERSISRYSPDDPTISHYDAPGGMGTDDDPDNGDDHQSASDATSARSFQGFFNAPETPPLVVILMGVMIMVMLIWMAVVIKLAIEGIQQ
ncbi:hypothetical protein BDZ91DRAFT_851782 [Kalaharituber pfeilii]|nr:hypothetical protein BDZ91DRAFT_851782 [Kalaharituber pfeilii]